MIRALLILIFGSVCLAALATPALYTLILSFDALKPWPYSRVFDRVWMLTVLIFLILQRRSFPWGSLRGILGQNPFPQKLKHFFAGLFLSAIPALVAIPMVVAGGALAWSDRPVGYLVLKLLAALGAAVLISFIEELFFRATLFRRLQKAWSLLPALFVSSIIYAAVHFIAPVKSYQFPGWSLTVGFEYLTLIVERIMVPATLPAVFGLFLVGAILCFTFDRTKSIFLCIGLHAGWIMAVKFTVHATTMVAGAAPETIASQRFFLVAQPIGWLAIVVVIFGVLLFPKAAHATPVRATPHLFASTNQGKIEEVRAALAQWKISVISPDQLTLASPPEVPETADTYDGNARLKAQALFEWSHGIPTVADDTGLEVEALDGRPGVYSARYAGEQASSRDNVIKLLGELADRTDRRAAFVCVLIYLYHDEDGHLFEKRSFGRLPGRIAETPRGDGGFGYDSVFIPDGHELTLAELKASGTPIKTHRILALTELFGRE